MKNAKLIIISASLIISFLAISSARAEVGLVALYHMDEASWDGTPLEVLDSSGQGNHGRAYGGASIVLNGGPTTPDGYDCGNCGSFDGINDYVNCGDMANFERTDAFSVEAWINTTQYDSVYAGVIVSRIQTSSNRGWIADIFKGQIRFILINLYPTNGISAKTTLTFNNGNWHHIVCTYDGSSTSVGIHIWVDGTNQTGSRAGNLTGTILNSGRALIGHRDDVVGHWYQGKIDEVAIYNLVLSASEILDHYEEGPPEGLGAIDIYKTSGTYVSSVKDAGQSVSWSRISWEEDASYGEELEPESGMMGLWHMDDDWTDSSGNENNGTDYGATFVATGKFNTSGGKFDGSNDYVNCGNDNSLNIRNTITIEAWIKPDTLSTVNQNSIVSKSLGYWFFVSKERKLSFLRFNANDPPVGILGRFSVFSTVATIPTGIWTHAAATYDTTTGNTVKLYIDGELSREGSFTNGQINSTASSLTIGKWQNLHFFDGTIDEVAIYNRVLTASEILEHCKRGACNLRFQMRSGNTDSPTGDFVGPDGTTEKNDYFTDSGGEDIDVPDNRYFQYKAYFSTEDKKYTPELHSVTVTYSLPGTAGARTGPYIYHWEEVFE